MVLRVLGNIEKTINTIKEEVIECRKVNELLSMELSQQQVHLNTASRCSEPDSQSFQMNKMPSPSYVSVSQIGLSQIKLPP